MTFEIFMMGLLLVSVLTGLFTEAIKGWLLERGKKFYCMIPHSPDNAANTQVHKVSGIAPVVSNT